MTENTTDKKINILEKTGCKAELLEIISGAEDNEILHDLHTYALRRIRRNREKHHVSEADYADVIMEMVDSIRDDKKFILQLYIIISKHIKKRGC